MTTEAETVWDVIGSIEHSLAHGQRTRLRRAVNDALSAAAARERRAVRDAADLAIQRVKSMGVPRVAYRELADLLEKS